MRWVSRTSDTTIRSRADSPRVKTISSTAWASIRLTSAVSVGGSGRAMRSRARRRRAGRARRRSRARAASRGGCARTWPRAGARDTARDRRRPRARCAGAGGRAPGRRRRGLRPPRAVLHDRGEPREALFGERDHDRLAVREEVVERPDPDARGLGDGVRGERLRSRRAREPSAATQDRVEARARARLARDPARFQSGTNPVYPSKCSDIIEVACRVRAEEPMQSELRSLGLTDPGRSGWR